MKLFLKRITKYNNLIISLLLLLILTTFLVINSTQNRVVHASPSLGITIVIDAGHGGIDPGCIGRLTKITEAELNLKIAKKLESLLLSSGFEVVLTRKNENGLYGIYDKNYKERDMAERKRIIEEAHPELAISIHMNSFTSTKSRGAQVFFEEKNEKSKVLAEILQELLKNNIEASTHDASLGDYYILHATNYPTVLCECGYLSNPEDEKLLTDEKHQDKLAYNLYAGIVSYINSSH